MFSEYKFDKEILNEYLHIYNDEDKIKVLKKLYEEKKNICNQYNIEYDINEEKEILTPRKKDEIQQSNDSCILF
jgi:cytochrome oxidase Cu insertion factor (SCO1/SenC/PrrC family)